MPRILRRAALIVGVALFCLASQAPAIGAASSALVPASAAPSAVEEAPSRRPLLLLTGRESDLAEASCHLATAQAAFEDLWIAHAGARVERAAQGWPMPPQIDFERCVALFVFGGDRTNSNGFRVMDILEDHGAVTVRVESISFQTSSFSGPDPGVPGRPWALLLLERTGSSIVLEENGQRIIGREPIWKQRAAFEVPVEAGSGDAASIDPAPDSN